MRHVNRYDVVSAGEARGGGGGGGDGGGGGGGGGGGRGSYVRAMRICKPVCVT